MKKTVFNLIAIICFTVAVLPLMAPACREDEMNVGYYSIDIPGYEEADYLNMLNSSNKEIQYNAICELTMLKDYNNILTTDSLKGSAAYDSALMIYQKIYQLMQSDNSWVSSAAIRFISTFEYNRSAFVESNLKNNLLSLNVQLEIMMNLVDDTIKNQTLLNQKIKFLQQQPSWLLQNGSYLLMGRTDSIPSYQLMKTYAEQNEEYKKLLILDVLCNHITDSVFSFLTTEWAATKNGRIKKIIFDALPHAINQQLVLQWFAEHLPLLEANLDKNISHLNEKEIYGKLIVLAIEKGWRPSALPTKSTSPEYDHEPKLYVYLFENKYAEYSVDSIKIKQSTAGKLVEDALLNDVQLKNEWLSFEKRMLKYPLPMEFIRQHQLLTDMYYKQSAALLQQHQIDTSLSKEFLKETESRAKQLYKEKVRIKK